MMVLNFRACAYAARYEIFSKNSKGWAYLRVGVIMQRALDACAWLLAQKICTELATKKHVYIIQKLDATIQKACLQKHYIFHHKR